MSTDQEFLELLQKEFLDEVTFLLEQCEESYLNLESPDHREEELGKIFRMAHSMKGAGAAVGFSDLSGLAHVVEDALSVLRTRPDLIDNDIISLLLRSGDELKNRVQMLRSKDQNPWNADSLKDEIRVLVAHLKELTGVDQSQVAQGAKSPPMEIEDILRQAEEEEKAAQQKLKSMAPAPDADAFAASMTATPLAETSLKQDGKINLNAASKVGALAPPSVDSSRSPKAEASLLKIDAERIDNVLNIVGELVVVKSQLINQATCYAGDVRLAGIVSLIDKTIRELQDRTLSLRMTPLKTLFMKTQRVIRDLSLKLNKSIELKTVGEEIEIDRTMVDLLSDPLLHMARNSLDHGIENSETRLARGKDPKGKIVLTASQMGGRVVLSIVDDGGGINKLKVLKKAQEKGLIAADLTIDQVPEKEIFAMLFAPGFSTAEKVTDVSGRGVGMDVVNTNIEKLRGTIELKSEEGKGTTVLISIPLTTSITDGLVVSVSNSMYIMPMDSIIELVDQIDDDVIQMVDGRLVFRHREKVLPLIRLSQFNKTVSFVEESNPSSAKLLMLVEAGSRRVAMQVDSVVGQTQVVLKSLGENFKNIKGIAGAAILGDGKIALIMDPVGLVDHFREQAA